LDQGVLIKMHKQLFYFGDLDFLLKEEYFKNKLNYKYFLEFVEKLKNKEFETNPVLQLQYKDLTGVNNPILLSKAINTDYVCHIDQPQQLTIKNHNFTEMECNIKSKSGLFGLLCVSSVMDNIEQLIQDISKEHIGLIFSINNNVCFSVDFDKNNLDYKSSILDMDGESYCDCGVVSYHYQIYAHEIKLNNKRLFVVNN
jgi:hypothetical protein